MFLDVFDSIFEVAESLWRIIPASTAMVRYFSWRWKQWIVAQTAPPTCRASWWDWRHSWWFSLETRSCRCLSGWHCRFSLDLDLKTEGWRHKQTLNHTHKSKKIKRPAPSWIFTCRSAARTSEYPETSSQQRRHDPCWGWSLERRTPASRRTSTSSYKNQFS